MVGNTKDLIINRYSLYKRYLLIIKTESILKSIKIIKSKENKSKASRNPIKLKAAVNNLFKIQMLPRIIPDIWILINKWHSQGKISMLI